MEELELTIDGGTRVARPGVNDPKLIAKMPFDMKIMTTGMFKVIVST